MNTTKSSTGITEDERITMGHLVADALAMAAILAQNKMKMPLSDIEIGKYGTAIKRLLAENRELRREVERLSLQTDNRPADMKEVAKIKRAISPPQKRTRKATAKKG